ncbi:MAG: porin [Rhodospirillaceae bacterium]|nr:porin [Rhodospirillaceae bacterium]MBT5659527.1 porin [Rhodospirillaceae bacterium]MBT5751775.1 porin [Rhodospirillaceae bacterium]
MKAQYLFTTALAAPILVATLGIGPAQAADKALEAQVQSMQNELITLKSQVSGMKAPEKDKGCEAMSKGSLSITCDGFSAKMIGRIMVDAAFFNEDKSRMGDGTEFRRARLGLTGKLFKDWQYKAEWDFAGNNVSAKDIWLAYNGFKSFHKTKLTIGHLKVPMMLENMTSSRHATFMERSTAQDAFVGDLGDRQIGVTAAAGGHQWSLSGGIFGADMNDNAGNEGDEDWLIGGRGTFAPINEKGRVIHLGVWGNYMDNEDNGDIALNPRPESHIAPSFVDTGTITNTDNLTRWGAELAGVYGPASIQGEYVATHINRYTAPGQGNANFDGWYVEASYFLTGESRKYKGSSGKFDRVKPLKNLSDGGLGAWQVAARYSDIDLNDASASIAGGREENITLGLNWLPNPYVKFMANYIWVNNDDNATDNAANLKTGETSAGNDDPQIFQIRAQVDF